MRLQIVCIAGFGLLVSACGPHLGSYAVGEVSVVSAYPDGPDGSGSIEDVAKHYPKLLRVEIISKFDLSKAETGAGLYVHGDFCPLSSADRLIVLEVKAKDGTPVEGWQRKTTLEPDPADGQFHYFLYLAPSSPARKAFSNSQDVIPAYDLRKTREAICLRLTVPAYYITKSVSHTLHVPADAIVRALALTAPSS